ncbi:type II toxin-antitoxin system VapC family toxin [Inquilinus sp. CAU 1745]|uniref:type II toxin-antitoxin system VapC family toxin n=1 Tax=Inquilinus sp. CAU 1745 TaxID=3140369 RepID=UPI00325A532E
MTEIAVDPSAIVAIMLDEPEAAAFHEIMISASSVISAASWVELACVARHHFGPPGVDAARELLDSYGTTVAPVDAEQADIAVEGLTRFGKGRGEPPAALNFGDLFSYALARTRALPLLYKGNDFSRTDIAAATSG